MLRELSIENLAVIEKADVRFGEGFTVFTGETGAGKSILIGGINAVLGQRVTRDIVRTGTKKAVMSAVFDEIPPEVNGILTEMGFEPEDELMLTREIFADGKSAARINGRTATAAMLKEIGGLLVDIHGQHENRILMSNDSQRDILDSYAGLEEKMTAYRQLFREFSAVSHSLKKLTEEKQTRELKIEHLTGICEELRALDLSKGEGEKLEKELEKVRNAAKIGQSLWNAYNMLAAEETNASSLLTSAAEYVGRITDIEPKAAALYERLTAAAAEVSDISDELYSLTDNADADTEEVLAEKVSALKTAKRRYNMEADELVDYLAKCEKELAELSGADDRIEELLAEKHRLADRVKAAAVEISAERKAAAERLSGEICRQLEFLDMPNVKIIFAINSEKITVNGMDSVELLIAPNAGEEPRPLNKTASGGELSRIMLAIKSVLADCDNIPTLIFDEVDAGISGRAAQKVGVKLAETAKKRQVLCITHLAQIACKADQHLLIEKKVTDNRTRTGVTSLDFEGRKRELARIIDGRGESPAALSAAEDMLNKE